MDDLFESHFEETKLLLLAEAKKVVKNDQDFRQLKNSLAQVQHRANDLYLFSKIHELADSRRSLFSTLCKDKEAQVQYRNKIIVLLSDIIIRNI
jgi:hypothetical protein